MEGGMIGLNMLVSPIYIWRCLSTVSPRPREEGRSRTDFNCSDDLCIA